MADLKDLKVCEPIVVKYQVYKTVIETALLLVRIDDIVSGTKKKGDVMMDYQKHPRNLLKSS